MVEVKGVLVKSHLLQGDNPQRLNDSVDVLQSEQGRLTSSVLDMLEVSVENQEKIKRAYDDRDERLRASLAKGEKIQAGDLLVSAPELKKAVRADTEKFRNASNAIGATVTEFFRRCPR